MDLTNLTSDESEDDEERGTTGDARPLENLAEQGDDEKESVLYLGDSFSQLLQANILKKKVFMNVKIPGMRSESARYYNSIRNEQSRSPGRNMSQMVPILLANKPDFQYLILQSPASDVTDIAKRAGNKLTPKQVQKNEAEMDRCAKGVFKTAVRAAKDNPNLKMVVILPRTKRIDGIAGSNKALSEYGDQVLEAMCEGNEGHKHKSKVYFFSDRVITITTRQIPTNEEMFGTKGDNSGYDRVHWRGPRGKTHYNEYMGQVGQKINQLMGNRKRAPTRSMPEIKQLQKVHQRRDSPESRVNWSQEDDAWRSSRDMSPTRSTQSNMSRQENTRPDQQWSPRDENRQTRPRQRERSPSPRQQRERSPSPRQRVTTSNERPNTADKDWPGLTGDSIVSIRPKVTEYRGRQESAAKPENSSKQNKADTWEPAARGTPKRQEKEQEEKDKAYQEQLHEMRMQIQMLTQNQNQNTGQQRQGQKMPSPPPHIQLGPQLQRIPERSNNQYGLPVNNNQQGYHGPGANTAQGNNPDPVFQAKLDNFNRARQQLQQHPFNPPVHQVQPQQGVPFIPPVNQPPQGLPHAQNWSPAQQNLQQGPTPNQMGPQGQGHSMAVQQRQDLADIYPAQDVRPQYRQVQPTSIRTHIMTNHPNMTMGQKWPINTTVSAGPMTNTQTQWWWNHNTQMRHFNTQMNHHNKWW